MMSSTSLSLSETSLQLSNSLNAFIIATIASLIILLIARRKGFFELNHSSESASLTVTTVDLIKAFGVFFLVQLFVAPLLYLKMISTTINTASPPEASNFNLFVILCTFVGILIVFSSQSKDQKKVLFDNFSLMPSNLLLGIQTWLLAYPLVISVTQYLSSLILYFFQHSEREQQVVLELRALVSEPLLFLATALSIVLLVPFIEEYLFRGMLLNWLKTKMSLGMAIIVSSLIFSSMHLSFSQGITNIELFSGLMVLSCLLGYVYEKQRSLWAPIGLHATFNAFSAMMILSLDK